MPIPFDRFRLLNDTGRERKLKNFSPGAIEYQVDEEPVQVIPPDGEVSLPPGEHDVQARRQDENGPEVTFAVVFIS